MNRQIRTDFTNDKSMEDIGARQGSHRIRPLLAQRVRARSMPWVSTKTPRSGVTIPSPSRLPKVPCLINTRTECQGLGMALRYWTNISAIWSWSVLF